MNHKISVSILCNPVVLCKYTHNIVSKIFGGFSLPGKCGGSWKEYMGEQVRVWDAGDEA